MVLLCIPANRSITHSHILNEKSATDQTPTQLRKSHTYKHGIYLGLPCTAVCEGEIESSQASRDASTAISYCDHVDLKKPV